MNLLDYDYNETEGLISSLNQPRYRAKQVFEWLNRCVAPSEMSNIPKTLRDRLSELPFGGCRIHTKLVSAKDGTVKYLFELEDGNLVEGVLMRYNYGNTLCLSTQIGCDMGCAFCASTIAGCVRDLSSGEMLSMVAAVEADEPCGEGQVRTVTNIVLMGSGEPLVNYDNVTKFLRRVNLDDGMNISLRNISLSTCRIVPNILKLIDDGIHVTLCISLHAPNNEVRSQLMPINRKYDFDAVINAADAYAKRTGRRVIFEYALISNVNASQQHAVELAKRIKGINCHVNLIPLNSVKERDLIGVSRREAEQFAAWLSERHISATVRRELGTDIDGACGQLRRRVLEEL